jgi:transposase
MTFGGGVHRWNIVGRVHPSQNRGVQQINNQLIVTVTAILRCDWFCHATGIFCPRRFPPPNVISQTGLTLTEHKSKRRRQTHAPRSNA